MELGSTPRRTPFFLSFSCTRLDSWLSRSGARCTLLRSVRAGCTQHRRLVSGLPIVSREFWAVLQCCQRALTRCWIGGLLSLSLFWQANVLTERNKRAALQTETEDNQRQLKRSMAKVAAFGRDREEREVKLRAKQVLLHRCYIREGKRGTQFPDWSKRLHR